MSTIESQFDSKKTTKVCARHGKKRQSTFLVLSGEGEWICRDEDQCKISQGANKNKGIKLEEQMSTESIASESLPKGSPTSIVAAEPRRTFGDLTAEPSVISWADEVDQEFPEGLLASDDSRSAFKEQRFHENVPHQRWYTCNTQSYPPINNRRSNATPAKPKRTLGERSRPSPHYNEAELLHRIEQLQDEVGNTKRELRKAKEEMKAVLNNERMLDSIVQSLRTEVAEIRKKQLQLDLTGHDDRHRKPVTGIARLNPEATPFVPIAQCCTGHQPRSNDAARKEDVLRSDDSARSNVTNGSHATAQTALSVLEVESYDSDNFGISHEDAPEDGPYWSERDDDPRETPRPRSRSQETYDRVGVLQAAR